jgi:predicted aconitase
MLDGEYGYALETAMSVLAKLGDMYGADRMIEIDNVHVDASTYAGIHEAGLQFCKTLAKENARFRVPTTLCISAIDFNLWRQLRVPVRYVKKQRELADAYARMGATPTWTCAPYQYGAGIRFGQDIAWAESNAIAFANSVVGARTNRYADLVDVCAGLTGKVPRFGLYLNENRHGQVLLCAEAIETGHLSCTDYSALGYFIGDTVGQKIPVIAGLSPRSSIDHLKSLAAAAATSGSVALFHIVGVTPEARTSAEAFGNTVMQEKILIGNEELQRAGMQLSTVEEGQADLIVLGCPHYSVEQIGEAASLLEGRRVRSNVQVWLFTSRAARMLAQRKGYVKVIEAAGGKVLSDTCALHLPLHGWNFQTIATDSAKMAHYAPAIIGADVVFADTAECLNYATKRKGRVMCQSWKKR